MSEQPAVCKREPGKALRIILLVAGIALGQTILYGPSLVGRKILLPLDLLAGSGFYIPRTPDIAAIEPKDGSLSDLICTAEPQRRFAISELRAGRLPMWAPYHYAGAPFVWPKFSPFLLFQTCSSSPIVLAWSQFLVAMVAGIGAYMFLRRTLAISFWSSALCAWCYPLTGFFVLWEGFFTVLPVCWLPWLLFAVDRTVRGRSGTASVAVAAVTGLVIVSGQLDVAAQVLLCSGVYGVWRLVEARLGAAEGAPEGGGGAAKGSIFNRLTYAMDRRARRAALRLSLGWALGLLLAAPYFLPVIEYTQTGARMMRRGHGAEERPPIGLKALPQVILPNLYGTVSQPSLRYSGGMPQQESSASAYAGLVATLVLAPLAYCHRRFRSSAILWSILSVAGCGWALNIPGLVTFLRLPGLNMMSHNRLVFVTGFGVLVLASMGLQVLQEGSFKWRKWMWAAVVLLGGLCAFCVYRTTQLPEPVATEIPRQIARGNAAGWIHDVAGVRRLQAWFVQYYAGAALLCGFGVVGWVLLRSARLAPGKLIAVFGASMVTELLLFSYGRNVQSEPALYYPHIPVLEAAAKVGTGRVMGMGCLPATLASMCGLRDIRGYDAVDPARLVELVLKAGDPISIMPGYAPTMELAPKARITPEGDIQLPSVLDMLGVQYVIFRGAPFPKSRPVFQGFDYWVLKNPRALPRAFVPEHVEVITDHSERVRRLESEEWNPRELAFVEAPVDLPDHCRGTARITDEIPTRIHVAARMETAGLVVIADLWDKGWHASLDGKVVPILRANHAVRGVVVPAGTHQLEFSYNPASFVWGLRLAGGAAFVLLVWLLLCIRRHKESASAQVLAPAEKEQTTAAE